jgi:methionine-S-sulfoxide reductase
VTSTDKYETAIFAGGCFWCSEKDFKGIDGVISVTSGYTGGKTTNPTYTDICSGATGHVEAVLVKFDPNIISYKQLLDVFWHSIDPINPVGQFCDIGTQYKSAIFYNSDEQKQVATKSKKQIEESGRFSSAIATQIREASPFYPAEEYHQEYYNKNPERYNAYRKGSGRDRRLSELWED